MAVAQGMPAYPANLSSGHSSRIAPPAWTGAPGSGTVQERLLDFVKCCLLQQLVPPGATVCDLYCGRGMDTEKWARSQIGRYVGVDFAASALEEAREQWDNHNRPYPADFCEVDPCMADLQCELRHMGLPADFVCCMGHLQDCFFEEEVVKRLLQNVASILKPGGYFFGITADSSTIWSKYQKAVEGAHKAGSLRTSGVLPRVNSDYYVISFEDDRFTPFGTKYTLQFADGVISQSQLLIHFPSLIRLAEDIGLEYVEIQNLQEFYEDYRVQFFDTLRTTCGNLLDPKGRLLLFAYDVLSLYTTFIFKKADHSEPLFTLSPLPLTDEDQLEASPEETIDLNVAPQLECYVALDEHIAAARSLIPLSIQQDELGTYEPEDRVNYEGSKLMKPSGSREVEGDAQQFRMGHECKKLETLSSGCNSEQFHDCGNEGVESDSKGAADGLYVNSDKRKMIEKEDNKMHDAAIRLDLESGDLNELPENSPQHLFQQYHVSSMAKGKKWESSERFMSVQGGVFVPLSDSALEPIVEEQPDIDSGGGIENRDSRGSKEVHAKDKLHPDIVGEEGILTCVEKDTQKELHSHKNTTGATHKESKEDPHASGGKCSSIESLQPETGAGHQRHRGSHSSKSHHHPSHAEQKHEQSRSSRHSTSASHSSSHSTTSRERGERRSHHSYNNRRDEHSRDWHRSIPNARSHVHFLPMLPPPDLIFFPLPIQSPNTPGILGPGPPSYTMPDTIRELHSWPLSHPPERKIHSKSRSSSNLRSDRQASGGRGRKDSPRRNRDSPPPGTDA